MRRREFLTGSTALAVAWPRWSIAQSSGRVHRIGSLAADTAPGPDFPLWAAFRKGFQDLGYVEGQDVSLEARFAGGDLVRLPVLARELVEIPVEVLVVFGPTPMRAAHAAAKGVVPIVMVAGSSDPVGEGYVTSLARPGTNVTGLTYAVSAERFGKQLELLKEALNVSRVAMLWDGPAEIFSRSWAPALNEAARVLAIQIKGPFLIRATEELDQTFAAMAAEQVEAVLVAASGVLTQARYSLAEVAIRHRMPVMAAFREFPEAGVLMSYGPNMTAIYRRAAAFVDKILKGTPPGEIPVEQPAHHLFIINQKTARAMGITLEPTVLAVADEVIE